MSSELRVWLHQRMLRVRIAEETIAERYSRQEIRTPVHLGTGQEAVAVGVCGALNDDDVIFSHHRCHNHYLAKGGSLNAFFAELFGREDGCSRGRGGSVHLTDLHAGVVATSAIVGQMVAVAVGAGYSFKSDKSNRVAATFFGDATLEEGGIYEAMNFASIHKTPTLFICENNLYSTESPLHVRSPKDTFGDRVAAFEIATELVDGNDVAEVWAAAQRGVVVCRNGDGPYFIECATYRWREHVGPNFDHDVGRTYRAREEFDAWKARCPIEHSKKALVRDGICSLADIEAWETATSVEVSQSVEFGLKSAWPTSNTLFENVW